MSLAGEAIPVCWSSKKSVEKKLNKDCLFYSTSGKVYKLLQQRFSPIN